MSQSTLIWFVLSLLLLALYYTDGHDLSSSLNFIVVDGQNTSSQAWQARIFTGSSKALRRPLLDSRRKGVRLNMQSMINEQTYRFCTFVQQGHNFVSVQ